jgi:hypothetical protein
MNTSEKLFASFVMLKAASPAWVQALRKGLLSPPSVKRLAQGLPKETTRQISTKAIGRGAEGKILPSFSGGGVGESVIKLLHRPNELKVNKINELFSQHPSIFPEVTKVLKGGKGYAMPKYFTNPPTGLGASVKDLMGIGSGSKWRDFLTYLQSNAATRTPIKLTSRFSGMAPVIKQNLPSELNLGKFNINDLSRYSNNVMFTRAGKPVIVDPFVQ